MKKQVFPVLLAVTAIFLSFTLGLFTGRNLAAKNIQISTANRTPLYADKVPEVRETESSKPEETISLPVNINTATQSELTALPGIGDTLAKRILDYRKQNGSFSAPEELLNISGIGAQKLEAILDLITTGG